MQLQRLFLSLQELISFEDLPGLRWLMSRINLTEPSAQRRGHTLLHCFREGAWGEGDMDISRLREADCSPSCKWATPHQLEARVELKLKLPRVREGALCLPALEWGGRCFSDLRFDLKH